MKFVFCWSLIWFALIAFFGMTGESGGGVSSDGAIPIIMANAPGVTAYDLYYYGQNRFGAVFFLIMRAIGYCTGKTWGFESFFLVHAALLSLAICIFLLVFCRRSVFICIPLLIYALRTSPTLRDHILSPAHPYGWQLSLLLIFASTLKYFRDSRTRFVFLSCIACLSCWISAASFPMLATLSTVVAFAMCQEKKVKTYCKFLAPCFIGFAFERCLNWIYVSFVERQYTRELAELMFSVTTNEKMSFHWKHLQKALRAFLFPIAGFDKYLIWAVIVLLVIFARRIFRNKSWREKPQIFWPIALAGAALANLSLVIFSEWVALNGHPLRYITTTVGLLVCGALVCLDVIKFPKFLLRILNPAAAIFFMGFCYFNFSPSTGNLSELRLPIEKLRIAEQTLLLGEYWNTYVFQAIEPQLLALPSEGQWIRNPDVLRQLPKQTEILACLKGEPPLEWKQYKQKFALKDAKILQTPLCQISRYRRLP